MSVGGAKTSRAGTSSWGDAPSQLPPPPRSMLPTLLLLKPQYFDKLFNLMQTLGEMTIPGNKGVGSRIIFNQYIPQILTTKIDFKF